MSEFAKLFKRTDDAGVHQLLVTKHRDAERRPAVEIRFNTPKGNHCRLAMSFDTVEERDGFFNAPNLDEVCWDMADQANTESKL